MAESITRRAYRASVIMPQACNTVYNNGPDGLHEDAERAPARAERADGLNCRRAHTRRCRGRHQLIRGSKQTVRRSHHPRTQCHYARFMPNRAAISTRRCGRNVPSVSMYMAFPSAPPAMRNEGVVHKWENHPQQPSHPGLAAAGTLHKGCGTTASFLCETLQRAQSGSPSPCHRQAAYRAL